MNLQKEVTDYVIVFMDRSVKFITNKQAEQIDMISSTPGTSITGVDVDDGHYKFSTMAKVISTKEYYKQYPQQRPSQETPEFNTRQIVKDFKPGRRTRALRNMINGLQKFIDSKGGKEKILPKTSSLLKKMKYQLSNASYEKR